MKVLLDENLDVRFRHHLPGHDVFSVHYMKWKGLENGELIAQAAADGFGAMIATDKAMPHQQNPKTLPLALLVIFSNGNRVEELSPFAQKVLEELKTAKPGMIIEIRP